MEPGRERTATHRVGLPGEPSLTIESDELPSTRKLRQMIRANRPRQRLAALEAPATHRFSGRRLAVVLVSGYQRWISPRMRARCLLEPSCSQYALLAIQHHGVLRGSLASIRRLRRCRPENEGTIDYPEGVSVAVPHHEHRQGL